MSEKKDWQKEIREIMASELSKVDEKIIKVGENVMKMLGTLPSSETEKTESKEEEHKHFQATDDICPGCYPVVRKKVIEKEFKDADYKCLGCGLPVKGEKSAKEDWKCPNCGETQAIPKD